MSEIKCHNGPCPRCKGMEHSFGTMVEKYKRLKARTEKALKIAKACQFETGAVARSALLGVVLALDVPEPRRRK